MYSHRSYNHAHYLIPEYFQYPKILPIGSHFPFFTTYFQPLARLHVLSVSVDLPLLDTSGGIRQHVLLYAWLLLFCMFPKLIHVVASINMPFHSLATQHSVAWICYSLLSIHQLIGNWIISNRKCESANFLLLFQDGFGSSVSHICILILGSTCQFLQKEHLEF